MLLESIAGTSKFDADIAEIEARIVNIDTKLEQLALYLGDSYRILEGLEKEKDRFLSTKADEKDIKKELEILNNSVIHESRTFFQRVLDCLGQNR